MRGGARELRDGWRNLSAATGGIGLGIASYPPVSSLFFHALETEFGWSRAAAAGALIALPITTLVLPLAGFLVDRFGVRLVSGASAATSVASYSWLSHMGGDVKEFYATLIVLNALGCATGPVAYTRLVAAQFRARRGLALAAAQFGIAFIGVLMPQVIGAIIEAHGWRGAYMFFAAAAGVGGLCAQLLMQPAARPDPADPQTRRSGRVATSDCPMCATELRGFFSATRYGPDSLIQHLPPASTRSSRSKSACVSPLASST